MKIEDFEEEEPGLWVGKNPLFMVYDSGDALGPFYYYAVDLIKEVKGFKILKISDWYDLSERSQEKGSQQMRMHYQITDASTLLKYINEIFRTYTAIRKDYQRVKECLDYYKNSGKMPADLVLKGIWADFIDTKSGAASMAQASQKFHMFALRDYFFRIEKKEDIDKFDTTKRIKTILERKYQEYLSWKEQWKESLDELDKILKERIKVNKNTIKIYKEWTKPLLRNIKNVSMGKGEMGSGEGRLNPELLKVSSSTYSQVELIAYKPAKGEKWRGEVEETKTLLHGREKVPFMPVVKFTFTLRGSSPAQFMKTELRIQPMVMTSKKFYEKYKEWQKDDVEQWFEELALDEDFEKAAEEIKDKKSRTYVGEIISYFKKRKKKEESKEDEEEKSVPRISWYDKHLGKAELHANLTANKAKDLAWFVYDIEKKAFGMLSWPVDLEF